MFSYWMFLVSFQQIPPTMTRILLNHFKWDLEKLYEKYYDGDQETLFQQAHIVYPFKGSALTDKVDRHLECFRLLSM